MVSQCKCLEYGFNAGFTRLNRAFEIHLFAIKNDGAAGALFYACDLTHKG